MERHNVQCIFCVLHTKLSEVIVLKCKASVFHFWFGLVSIREHDLSDFCREVFVGVEEGAAVPLGPCVVSGLGWAALVVTRVTPCPCSPGPAEELCEGEDDAAALPSRTCGQRGGADAMHCMACLEEQRYC